MSGSHIPSIPNVLSIAGSDPSGGAGIQADLKTFAALGCYGMAVPAALTAQNTSRVSAIHLPPVDFVAEQIRMIFADIEVAAVKVGMLGTPDIVETVADLLARQPGLPVVVDPVMTATGGAVLGDDAVTEAMRDRLFPLATLITPNLAEAARLAGKGLPLTRSAIEVIAKYLKAGSAAAWLVKGGHGTGETADDLLLDKDLHWLSSPRVATRETHGTGCTLSSAIAAFLALGRDLPAAVTEAKAFINDTLAGAAQLRVGHGGAPLDHFVRLR